MNPDLLLSVIRSRVYLDTWLGCRDAQQNSERLEEQVECEFSLGDGLLKPSSFMSSFCRHFGFQGR